MAKAAKKTSKKTAKPEASAAKFNAAEFTDTMFTVVGDTELSPEKAVKAIRKALKGVSEKTIEGKATGSHEEVAAFYEAATARLRAIGEEVFGLSYDEDEEGGEDEDEEDEEEDEEEPDEDEEEEDEEEEEEETDDEDEEEEEEEEKPAKKKGKKAPPPKKKGRK